MGTDAQPATVRQMAEINKDFLINLLLPLVGYLFGIFNAGREHK
jgi:uncharacterized membrane protein YqaE (UPF0057 family)